ncbi:translation initiation factor IF-3 [Streptomyces sp. NPDC097617]|uniref:translation initiation factor IF-3 n=1 Tax=Streptomyces sp. NPDC097617 TaxID=3366091 RepID=UPI0037FA999D
MLGVLDTAKARVLAAESSLDLVEISTESDPPVAKILNHQKWLFQQKKAHAAKPPREKGARIQDVRMRAGISDTDYEVKAASVRRFLAEGSKVKVAVKFRSHEDATPEIADPLLKKVAADLSDIAVIESDPKPRGRSFVMTLAPAKSA